jgi:hypothetical protein
MTETEVYFAQFGRSGKDVDGPRDPPKPEAAVPIVSSRNEIRAMTHLSKLLKAEAGGADDECRSKCIQQVIGITHAVSLSGLPDDDGLPVSDETEAAACVAFEEWCKDEGVSTSLVVRDFKSTGRGLAASRDLEAGENVIRTPFHLFLNTEDVATSRFAHVFNSVRGLDERASHILMVMMEKADSANSPW